ncbi:HAD family hydrolase [Roseovarius sp. 2305UL8-3]|uniref:HAD family hydrolase n=1 Tax=Roseovarius conchicola TaxID=3121636 RepID=UPI0035275917
MNGALTWPAAVLFDCDGVLVDSEPITNRLLRDDLAAHGLDVPLEQIMTLSVGGTMEGVAEAARQRGAILPDDWVDRFYQIMFAGLEHEVEAVPGVSAVLDHLIAAGIGIAVGSNGPRAKMDITLHRTGLMDRLFPHIYSARDLAHPKPAPDVYLHAARQLGVAPRACVVVEDSASGAQAAVAAGMPCIGFAPAHMPSDQAEKLARHCNSVIADMSMLPRHIGL